MACFTSSTLSLVFIMNPKTYLWINGLVQQKHNSIANALELRLACTNPSVCYHQKFEFSMEEILQVIICNAVAPLYPRRVESPGASYSYCPTHECLSVVPMHIILARVTISVCSSNQFSLRRYPHPTVYLPQLRDRCTLLQVETRKLKQGLRLIYNMRDGSDIYFLYHPSW